MAHKESNWEIQFSKKFTDNVLRGGYGNDLLIKEATPIMKFIKKTLSADRERVKKQVENLMDLGALAAGTERAMEHNSGWENCKHHVLALLEPKEEIK